MQWYALIAVVVGLVLALLAGGRPRYLAGKSFRWWPLLFLGLVLQIVVEFDGVPAPFAVLLLSYAYLLVFAAANLRHAGMGLIFIGIALNAVVIGANGAMPVRESAVRSLDVFAPGEPIGLDEVKHELEGPDSRLMVLADIIPVEPIGQVLSFGDLVLCVGVSVLTIGLMRPDRRVTRRRRAPRARAAGEAPDEPPAPVQDLFAVRTPAASPPDIREVVDLTAYERVSPPAAARVP